jgi:TPR repeat protein
VSRRVLIGVLAALIVGLAGLSLYIYLIDHKTFDPLERPRKDCGEGDASRGDRPAACIGLAMQLMGQDDVKVDDDAARAILKRSCDHAHQASCDLLAAFDSTKLDILEGRCSGSWFKADPSSCFDAGRRHAEGRGASRPDATAARFWYGKGCALGLKSACEARDQQQ